jgi:chromatin-remodeling ATPase INO80
MMMAASDGSIGVLQDSLFNTLCDEHLDLVCIARNAWRESSLSRPDLKWFIPSAVAPAITLYTINRSFLEWLTRPQENALELLALCGVPQTLRDSEPACLSFDELLPGLSPLGLLNETPAYQIPSSPMQIPEAKRLIIDSAKLARLDVLLQELKAADHRVLIYFQMTRMMDLMEEYLIFRQYKYLRLDGSSKIEDRRDMVMDWQTRYAPDNSNSLFFSPI